MNKKEKVIKTYTEETHINYFEGDDINGVLFKEEQAKDTIEHILKHKKSVKDKLNFISKEISKRAEFHDNSKLKEPEINLLIKMDKEKKYPYGSKEYFLKMKKYQKFFIHHYKENRHHPEHFENGINDMNIIDICEYITDIISYYDEMHVDDALKTLEAQKKRFGFDEQLYQILKNTLLEYFTWIGSYAPICIQQKERL